MNANFFRYLLSFIFLAINIGACSQSTTPVVETQPPASSSTPTATDTLAPSVTPLPSPTPSNTPSPVPTITATSTPVNLYANGTPLPEELAPISFLNASQVTGLVAWKQNPIAALAWRIDGNALFLAEDLDILEYQVNTHLRLREFLSDTHITSLAASPDGNYLLAGHQFTTTTDIPGGSLEIWRLTDGNPLGPLFLSEQAVSDVAYSPDGSRFAVAFSGIQSPQHITLWETSDWTMTHTLKSKSVLGITFSPHGDYLAASPDRYAIKIWQMKDFSLLQTIHTSFSSAVNSMAFSPTEGMIATGHYDGSLNLWEVKSGKLVQSFETGSVVESLSFTPDGTVLASGSSYQESTIRLWDVQSGILFRTLPGHSHAVEHLAFSPDGKLLASASYDGEVHLWGVPPQSAP